MQIILCIHIRYFRQRLNRFVFFQSHIVYRYIAETEMSQHFIRTSAPTHWLWNYHLLYDCLTSGPRENYTYIQACLKNKNERRTLWIGSYLPSKSRDKANIVVCISHVCWFSTFLVQARLPWMILPVRQLFVSNWCRDMIYRGNFITMQRTSAIIIVRHFL